MGSGVWGGNGCRTLPSVKADTDRPGFPGGRGRGQGQGLRHIRLGGKEPGKLTTLLPHASTIRTILSSAQDAGGKELSEAVVTLNSKVLAA